MISENLNSIREKLPSGVKLVAVSKFHPIEAIREAVAAGQTVFGESRPQEFEKKAGEISGVEWHFIGHLQTNKLKIVLPYAYMVESVDSLHLLQDIEKWAAAAGVRIKVLLELHLGAEETKQGFKEEEILAVLFDAGKYSHIEFCGLMGMATNTDDKATIEADFTRIENYMEYLKDLFPEIESFRELSIGMSGDWETALKHKATIVRIGTAIFGERITDR